jgi:hypothetical protein
LPSKTLSRPQIFTAIQLSKTATFEESGRDGGHLAALNVTVARLSLTFSAKVAGKSEKFCHFKKCRLKQLFQGSFMAKKKQINKWFLI